MKKKKTFRKKVDAYFYEHAVQKSILSNGLAVFVCALSGFIFAFGFRAFLAPACLPQLETSNGLKLVSGGVSGISQLIIAVIDLITGGFVEGIGVYDVFYSCFYFGLNVPIIILAFRGIGKRYTLFTLMTVGFSSLFSTLLRYADDSLFTPIAVFVDQNGGLVTRALLAGVCTGISSAIAYRIDGSAGGIDVVAHYIAIKKSQLVGKYSVAINFVTVTLYTIVSITAVGWGTSAAGHVFVASLFSILYLFVCMMIIDLINSRNRKVRIEVITEMPDLGKILIGSVPHGATMTSGKGVFSGREKFVLTMIVSTREAKPTAELIREIDPGAFVTVTDLRQVYGRFYLPPIR